MSEEFNIRNHMLENNSAIVLEIANMVNKAKSNLTYMRWFYNTYPDYNKISELLSWSHYIELITIKNEEKRSFYEKECINSNWSLRITKAIRHFFV